MPEGDTVWHTADRLHRALAGERLVRCDFRVPRLATVDLTGRRVVEVVPRGKHLLARFSGGLTLHSHLRIDGAWHVYRPDERWRGPGHQVRAVLGTGDHTAVGFRLQVLDLLRTTEERRVVGHLGPDLLGADWDPDEALRRLVAEPSRPFGEALLDQRNLAGIGNVYKCELCFLLGVSPWLPTGRVPAPERLPALAKKLLEANKTRLARVTTTDSRSDRRLWVYGRVGRPCRRCGTAIAYADGATPPHPARQRSRPEGGPGSGVPGGGWSDVRNGRTGPPGAGRDADSPPQERITFWCPRCQPSPTGG